jgi:hypothetical protein
MTANTKNGRRKFTSGSEIPTHEATNRLRGIIGAEAGKVLDALTFGLTLWDSEARKVAPSMVGLLPVTVENIGSISVLGQQVDSFSVCQYGKQNGDPMRDPEVCVVKLKCGAWICFYFRNDYCFTEQSEQHALSTATWIAPSVIDTVAGFGAFVDGYALGLLQSHESGVQALMTAAQAG